MAEEDMDVSTTDDDDDNEMDELVEDYELIARYRREGRKSEAEDFRREYLYGSSMDQKTLVWPGGTYSWMDKSSGIVWVGVYGTNSICVVTRTGDLDITRVLRFLKHLTVETVLRRFRRTVISELEDLASPSSKLRDNFDQSIPKTFGVVSVILGSDKVHKESGHEVSSDEDESIENMRDKIEKYILKKQKSKQHSLSTIAEYDKKKTITFLQEQMGRETTLTINETIQASSTEYDVIEATKFLLEKMEASTVDETVKSAISAFQILFQKKKFKANEIEVSVMDPNYFVSVDEPDDRDIYVKHLEMSDIEEHLAAINEPGS